jgi:hypothetical protein
MDGTTFSLTTLLASEEDVMSVDTKTQEILRLCDEISYLLRGHEERQDAFFKRLDANIDAVAVSCGHLALKDVVVGHEAKRG